MKKNSSMMNIASDRWCAAPVERKPNIFSALYNVAVVEVPVQSRSYIETQAAIVDRDPYRILDSVRYSR